MMRKILFHLAFILAIFNSACNTHQKNPFDTSKNLDLTTGDFNSQYVELVIKNNNSTVLNGCALISIEMDRNGQKIGAVKKLCSGPWQPKQTQTINLDWDYYKTDVSQTGAGNYIFNINSETPKYCD
jgi:hypothetical protein